ncbi:MAG: DUF3570 domain-containing protein [Nannocystaceae bacterium]
MRLRLTWAGARLVAALTLPTVVSTPTRVLGDDRVIVRGNYYREASTRVLQPMVSFSKQLPDERVEVGLDYLLDAISSASIASGSAVLGGDQVFTEMRHEATAKVSSRLGPWAWGTHLRYSTETDYTARSAGISLARDLLRRTLTFSGRYAYGLDRVYRITDALATSAPWRSFVVQSDGTTRPGPTNLLQSHYVGFSASHVVTPRLWGATTLELARLQGPQDNPYRTVGNGLAEVHPWRRRRVAPSASLRWAIPRTPLTAEQHYRYYSDDWDVSAHMTDTRLYLRLPRHLRTRGRYRFYTQTGASFARGDSIYLPTEVHRTSDPKLSAFLSHTAGIELTYEFDGLARVEAFRWLDGAWIQATYNHVFQTNRYGNARLGSLAFSVAY